MKLKEYIKNFYLSSVYDRKLESIRKLYYPNRKLREEFRYFDGLENAKGTLYHKNCKLTRNVTYKEGTSINISK